MRLVEGLSFNTVGSSMMIMALLTFVYSSSYQLQQIVNNRFLKSPYSIPYNIFCNSEVTIHDSDSVSDSQYRSQNIFVINCSLIKDIFYYILLLYLNNYFKFNILNKSYI